MMQRPSLLTRTQAAHYLGVSTSWLSKHADDGPSITRMGRKVFYQQRDLDAYLRAQRSAPKTVAKTKRPKRPAAPRSPRRDDATRMISQESMHQLLRQSRDTSRAVASEEEIIDAPLAPPPLPRQAKKISPPPVQHAQGRVTPPTLPQIRARGRSAPPTLPHVRAKRLTPR